MKFSGLKIFKFSTIVKKIDRITDSLSLVYRSIRRIQRNIVNSLTSINLKKLDFRKIYRIIDPRKFNFFVIIKKTKFLNYKYLSFYFVSLIIIVFTIYSFVPIFYNYDSSMVEKKICKNINIKCSIKGEVKYKFFPTPRIKIKDLIIKDTKKNKTFGKIKVIEAKLYMKNLLNKQKQNFKNVKLNDFEISIDLKNLDIYQNIFKKNIDRIPLNFVNGKIIFYNKEKYVATINETNFKFITKEKTKKSILKGIFLGDEINIDFENKVINGETSAEIVFKMSDLNLITKTDFSYSLQDKKPINGNILIKKDKQRFMGIFSYQDGEIIINKSNIRNSFLDGKLEGQIKFLPYFNFDLDLNLNSINFTRLYSYFLTLDKERLFKINNKINGNLDLSAEKIYSSYNLVKTFESEIKFNNGNIAIERFLINLGKLGAADVLGEIKNDKKFSNFKYESNVFIDNQKKFLSKFGIYNKQSISSNFFISGSLNLKNARSSFYEISGDKKFDQDDINFIEKEFNNLMLVDGYESLFRFPKFKEFIKSITMDIN